MLPSNIQNLIREFSRLPGIGPRQAARFAFYLMRNEDDMSSLLMALDSAKEGVALCESCFLPAKLSSARENLNFPEENNVGSSTILCAICGNSQRNKNHICIVEKETDAVNFEKSGYFQGHYYILGGFIDPLEENSIARYRLGFLFEKAKQMPKNEQIEMLVALSPRKEGDFTSLFIEDAIKPLKDQGYKIKITRLARGLSSGAELEYADQDTIKNAFNNRY